MSEVLENTAGYVDSELSDYESGTFEEFTKKSNDLKFPKSLKNYYLTQNYTTNNVYNLKANYKQDFRLNNPHLNRFTEFNPQLLECVKNDGVKLSDFAQKQSVRLADCVSGGLKSPRFGRDEPESELLSPQKLNPNNSFDTVDTLTPLTSDLDHDRGFRWWCDEQLSDSNFSLNSPNSTQPNDSVQHSELGELGDSVDEVKERDGEWKSWTVGSDELDEMKAKLMDKLLNREPNYGLEADSEAEKEDEFDPRDEQVKHYKNLNKLLVNQMLYLLNNNNYQLEYNLSNQYVTLVQNHLVKVHQYINFLLQSHSQPYQLNDTVKPGESTQLSDSGDKVKPNELGNIVDSVEDKDWPDLSLESESLKSSNHEFSDSSLKGGELGVSLEEVNIEEYNRLKLENLRLKQQLNKSDSVEVDDEKRELLEKLRLVEESKNNLQEDFKKTLTYMKLMKDRLKLLKLQSHHPYNKFNTVNYSQLGNSVNTVDNVKLGELDDSVNNRVNLVENGNGVKTMRNNTYNVFNSKPVDKAKLKRNNSCVRFNEVSELYVVPKTNAESKPFINDDKFSFFKKLFF